MTVKELIHDFYLSRRPPKQKQNKTKPRALTFKMNFFL